MTKEQEPKNDQCPMSKDDEARFVHRWALVIRHLWSLVIGIPPRGHGHLDDERRHFELLAIREREEDAGLAGGRLCRDPHGAVKAVASAAMRQDGERLDRLTAAVLRPKLDLGRGVRAVRDQAAEGYGGKRARARSWRAQHRHQVAGFLA